MKVGFTGTRIGLTDYQHTQVFYNLHRWAQDFRLEEAGTFLHGDCIGADAQSAEIARELGYTIEAFPSNQRLYRAFTNADILHTPVEPLRRNRLIVQQCEVLIACPSAAAEIVRSGTWVTVRYARNRGRKLIMIPPRV